MNDKAGELLIQLLPHLLSINAKEFFKGEWNREVDLILQAFREVAEAQREKDLKYLNVDIFQVYRLGAEAEECQRIRNTPSVTDNPAPDLKELERKLDDALASETKESLNKWLDEQRTDNPTDHE